MQNKPVSLVEAQELLLPTMMAIFGSQLLWLVCLALVLWSLVRLRRASSIALAIALVAATAVLVWVGSTVAWVSSLVLVLVSFVFFRRPDALLSVVCVVAWVTTTWMLQGWWVVYEETGECLFPGVLVVHYSDFFPDEVRCQLPQWL